MRLLSFLLIIWRLLRVKCFAFSYLGTANFEHLFIDCNARLPLLVVRFVKLACLFVIVWVSAWYIALIVLWVLDGKVRMQPLRQSPSYDRGIFIFLEHWRENGSSLLVGWVSRNAFNHFLGLIVDVCHDKWIVPSSFHEVPRIAWRLNDFLGKARKVVSLLYFGWSLAGVTNWIKFCKTFALVV